MIFSPAAVATIINLIISAHGSYVPDISPITEQDGMHIMFLAYDDKGIEVVKYIKAKHPCSLRTALASLTAVRAYLNIKVS